MSIDIDIEISNAKLALIIAIPTEVHRKKNKQVAYNFSKRESSFLNGEQTTVGL